MGNVDYNLKIHNLKKRIAILTKRKRYLQKKEQKRERIERARRLLKLGIIFEITFTTIYPIELIVGHLLELRNMQQDKIEDFRYLGEKILSENSIEKYDQEEIIFLNREERKARNHKLISLGALFEMTKTLYYPLAVQVGYIENLHLLNTEEREDKEKKGKEYIDNRRLKNERRSMERFL